MEKLPHNVSANVGIGDNTVNVCLSSAQNGNVIGPLRFLSNHLDGIVAVSLVQTESLSIDSNDSAYPYESVAFSIFVQRSIDGGFTFQTVKTLSAFGETFEQYWALEGALWQFKVNTIAATKFIRLRARAMRVPDSM